MRGLGLVRLAAHVEEHRPVRRELGHVAIGQDGHVARGVDHGDDVAGHVGAVFRQAHHQRRVLARRHDGARLPVAHHGERIGTDEALRRLAHGLQQVVVAPVGLFHQMRDHLGVGLARERMAAAFQLLAQFGVVLDDAVVDDGHMAVAGDVGMRIRLGRTAVRGPARVADAAGARQAERGHQRRKPAHLAFAVHDLQLAVLLDGDARRVVAAVLEPREPFHQDVRHGTRSRVADDSAHRRSPCLSEAASMPEGPRLPPRGGGASPGSVPAGSRSAEKGLRLSCDIVGQDPLTGRDTGNEASNTLNKRILTDVPSHPLRRPRFFSSLIFSPKQ